MRSIALNVVEENGLAYEVDVLVLKHAQALYGLDAQVVEHAGIDTKLLPPLDGYRIFRSPDGIAASNVLFIGVRPIRQFYYEDIRRFAYKALCSVASEVADAREVALTLHGIGYGLDEVACIEAELAGLLDAVDQGDVPHSLETVTLLEINPGRAKRMRARLPDSLEPDASRAATERFGPAEPAEPRVLMGVDAGSRRPHAFVAMPFDEKYSDRFHYGLSSAIHANGLLCERIDQQAFTGDILDRMKDRIRTAKFVVADLTGANENVFLEIGYAWGRGVPTVLVCEEESPPLDFDVQGQRVIFFKSIRDLEEKLTAELKALLSSG